MKKASLLLVLASCVMNLAAQELSSYERKAQKRFEKLDYVRTIEKLNGIDDLSVYGKRMLASSYRLTHKMREAEVVYGQLVLSDEKKAEDIYYYSFVLRENEKYLESDKWMNVFKEEASSDLRVKQFEKGKNKFVDLIEDQGQFVVTNLSVNTKDEDFGTTYYKDKIVFASSRESVKIVKRKWNGNHMSFLDLYMGDMEGVEIKNVEIFSKKTNNKYHEGPADFAKAGQFMAFTRSNYEGQSADGEINFKIFFSEDIDGTWSKPESFYLNDKDYSIGHPSLTEDGNTMFFASNMPGGFGGVDIYKVTRVDGGEWGKAINLGDEINTEGNEMFPFYHEGEQKLFFSSDGQYGLGGLDVFVSPSDNGEFKLIKNLGFPINSSRDDFSFTIDQEMSTGYLSSNREGGKGDDDLYSFVMNKPSVFDEMIKEELLDSVEVIKDTLLTQDDIRKDTSLESKMDKYMVLITSINFDLNKSEIRADAIVELDKIVKLMNDNPTMVVELGSHTDCRADKTYNALLSDKRAKSSANYIRQRITNPERIYGKGYGEEMLLNDCKCEGGEKSTCSEEEHQVNRRTEFKVISFESETTTIENNSPDSFKD